MSCIKMLKFILFIFLFCLLGTMVIEQRVVNNRKTTTPEPVLHDTDVTEEDSESTHDVEKRNVKKKEIK